jgi:hypothetical protein
MQAAAGLHGGPLEQLVAHRVRQAAQVGLGHRGTAVRRLLDALEHGLVRVGRHVAEGHSPHDELPERLGGVRVEHP